ncbi:MAG TPA: tRNA (guanosine(46)-N7)-methyltransferase TrmB [Sphingobacteriaceae bacterium]|nr:tRNA (guanosine(46)-N7)-methyltransferase TrmB [Sphingobacteriaceae bacterium]
MGKDKLRKFTEIDTFKNVHQLEDGKEYKGAWAKKHFGNENPIVLELACGKGEYSVNMAKHFPNKNFIGVDSKGNRIWRGAKTALEEGIENVAFLRIQIDHILDYFEENEVSEIWITFPDPQPQVSREKKRLTSPRFLERYKIILEDTGFMHLKTDNDGLHQYTAEILQELNYTILAKTEDLYKSDILDEILQIKTFYEKKYLAVGKSINYLKWV